MADDPFHFSPGAPAPRRTRRKEVGALFVVAVAIAAAIAYRWTNAEDATADRVEAAATEGAGSDDERATPAAAVPVSSLDPDSGSVPGGTGIDVCTLLAADKVSAAFHDVADDGSAGRRDGTDDPMGHCLWSLQSSTNLHVAVLTERGVQAAAADWDIAGLFASIATNADVPDLGDAAWFDAGDGTLWVRLDDAAMALAVPGAEATDAIRTGLIDLARLAAPRLAAVVRNPAPAPPPRAKTPATHGVGDVVKVGECYEDWIAHPGGGSKRTFGRCDETHTAEVVAVLDIGDQFAEYPTAADQRRFVDDICPQEAAKYYGGALPSGVDAVGAVSSERLWSEGGTRLECLVTHEPRTGSLRGAGR